MTWASRLAKLSAPKCLNVDSVDSAVSPPNPPISTNGTIDVGVFPQKLSANDDARPALPPEDAGEPDPVDAEIDPEREAIMAVRALQRVALPPLPGSLLYGAASAFACATCGREAQT